MLKQLHVFIVLCYSDMVECIFQIKCILKSFYNIYKISLRIKYTKDLTKCKPTKFQMFKWFLPPIDKSFVFNFVFKSF